MFDDNKSSDDASRLLAVIHLDADIRSSVIVDPTSPSDNSGNHTERVAAPSLFVRKRTPCVVFDLFPILVLMKIKKRAIVPVPPEDGSLTRVRSAILVIASHEFGISGQGRERGTQSGPKNKTCFTAPLDVWAMWQDWYRGRQ